MVLPQIDLSSVQLVPACSGSGKVELPPGPAQVESRPVRFQFGPRSQPVVKMTGEVRVQIRNDDERSKCGFEFMQLAKPVVFERQYSGQFPDDESTIINWGSHISNRFWLDGHTDDSGSDLVAARRPFMSRQPHHGDGASCGLFRNTLADHPSIGTPDWVMGENQKKHFLLKVNYQTEFITFHVFIHATKERNPLAMIKWTVEHEIVFQWAGGQLQVRVGCGPDRSWKGDPGRRRAEQLDDDCPTSELGADQSGQQSVVDAIGRHGAGEWQGQVAVATAVGARRVFCALARLSQLNSISGKD